MGVTNYYVVIQRGVQVKTSFYRDNKLEVGDCFYVRSSGEVNMVIDAMSYISDGDMTPIRIIDLRKGHVIARSTSIGLCLNSLGLGTQNIEILGKLRFEKGL